MLIERILVGVLLLAGFLWLRHRARRLDDGARPRALWGALLVLVPGLLAGKWLFERLSFGRNGNLAVELLGIAALIGVTGFVFMRPGRGEKEQRE